MKEQVPLPQSWFYRESTQIFIINFDVICVVILNIFY
jgi:hypothetical protein